MANGTLLAFSFSANPRDRPCTAVAARVPIFSLSSPFFDALPPRPLAGDAASSRSRSLAPLDTLPGRFLSVGTTPWALRSTFRANPVRSARTRARERERGGFPESCFEADVCAGAVADTCGVLGVGGNSAAWTGDALRPAALTDLVVLSCRCIIRSAVLDVEAVTQRGDGWRGPSGRRRDDTDRREASFFGVATCSCKCSRFCVSRYTSAWLVSASESIG